MGVFSSGGTPTICFDSGDGEKTGEIIGYPNNNISYTDTEKLDAYYMNFISNGMNKFAICYCMTDLIEFYDFNGNLHKRIHGPEQFLLISRSTMTGRSFHRLRIGKLLVMLTFSLQRWRLLDGDV